MATSREKIQQLGFWDAEVSDPIRGPKHDLICFWAQDNALAIARQALGQFFDRGWEDCDLEWDERCKEKALSFCRNNHRPSPKIAETKLEQLLQTRTGYQQSNIKIIGYADVLLDIVRPKVCAFGSGEVKIEWDKTLDGRHSSDVLIEAKSSIPILGDLLRQLNLYKTAFQGEMVVVSPDDRYAEKIREQGFHFVKCPIDL